MIEDVILQHDNRFSPRSGERRHHGLRLGDVAVRGAARRCSSWPRLFGATGGLDTKDTMVFLKSDPGRRSRSVSSSPTKAGDQDTISPRPSSAAPETTWHQGEGARCHERESVNGRHRDRRGRGDRFVVACTGSPMTSFEGQLHQAMYFSQGAAWRSSSTTSSGVKSAPNDRVQEALRSSTSAIETAPWRAGRETPLRRSGISYCMAAPQFGPCRGQRHRQADRTDNPGQGARALGRHRRRGSAFMKPVTTVTENGNGRR